MHDQLGTSLVPFFLTLFFHCKETVFRKLCDFLATAAVSFRLRCRSPLYLHLIPTDIRVVRTTKIANSRKEGGINRFSPQESTQVYEIDICHLREDLLHGLLWLAKEISRDRNMDSKLSFDLEIAPEGMALRKEYLPDKR